MFRGVILVFSGVMLGFRRVIFGSEGLYRVQWGYVVSIQHVDLPPCRAGSAVKTFGFNFVFRNEVCITKWKPASSFENQSSDEKNFTSCVC